MGEERLLAQARSGEVVDLDDLSQDERTVAAAFLRELCLDETAAGADPRGIRVSGAAVAGRLDLEYCELPFPLRLRACFFDTNPVLRYCRLRVLELDGCMLPSLDADGLHVDHDLVIRSSTVSWDVQLPGASIGGDLDLSGTTIGSEASGREGVTALDAAGIAIGGSLHLDDGFGAMGQIRLHRARIVRQLNCRRATLTPRGPYPVLVADGAEIGTVFVDRGFRAEGSVRLVGARIGGQLNCGDAELTSRAEPVLWAELATIEGGVYVQRGFRADGQIQLSGARIGGPLHCENATLRSDLDAPLSAEGADIGGDVVFGGRLSIAGGVSLDGASVGGALRCEGATIEREGGTALSARYARIGGALVLRNARVTGGLDLYKATASSLDDDLGEGQDARGSWAGIAPLVLEGFEYERFAERSVWASALRFDWLRGTAAFEPGAWRRLADVYRDDGRDDDARRALIARENDRLARGGLAPHQRLGRWILRVTIGHGYRPWLAGLWALAIVAVYALLVWRFPGSFVPEDAAAGGPQPFVYAADTFLPIIDFGEADAWTAVGGMRWAEWLVILLGWALTTIFVAGFTRVVRT
ncbi:MAG: hypothetical protein ACRDNI_01530 [Gaiellaceae bacterium]